LFREMGLVVTLILLNSPRLFGSNGEQALLDAAIHPAFDWDCGQAFISAFNMRAEDGQNLYRAFVEFLAGRYAKGGPVGGAIVSNEVDSQYVWGNAGEMPVAEYAREYCQAMRLAFLCGRRRAAKWRVYLSLDHYWRGLAHDVTQPLRYYPGRDMLDAIAHWSAAEGDFPWGVAHHPYPENLAWPDFWHDRSPDFTFSTPRITFKNLEVLPAYLAQPHLLHCGAPRRVIFSEQGFNSQGGALRGLTERMGEAGYVLAYLKARRQPTVDLMTHHAYLDNPREFGLNLGIRRYDAGHPAHIGEKKPIWYAVRDMDSPAEPARVASARAFIGEELFDYLLDPPLVRGERDTSRDGQFG
ncbi:MAG: hypothetical protein GX558_09080, partial [Clostridiales bacterium]|nr:hypothetical protein [Clostridiales bacterium]